MSYGSIIPNLKINGVSAPYGVVNDCEVRAASGIMFALGFFTFFAIYYERNLKVAFVVLSLFCIDFILKVFFGPNMSIFGRIGAFLVRNQKPEYVGAIQKRFAWSIGLAMSSVVWILIVHQLFFVEACGQGLPGMGASCFFPMILCGICLIFLWFESAVGFCVGCSMYTLLVRRGIIKPKNHAPACPGGVCEMK